MAAGPWSLVLQQGEPYTHTFTLTGYDLTGKVGVAQVRAEPGAAVVLTPTVTIDPVGTTGGTIVVAVTAAQTNAAAVGAYEWDLFIRTEGDIETGFRLLNGPAPIHPRITTL